MRDTTEAQAGHRFQTGHVLALAGAHFLHDVFTAFLAPLLPLLIGKLGLTLAQAGSLRLFLELPSLGNVLLGAWLDRKRLTFVLATVTPAVTGLGMCLAGAAPSYAALTIVLLTCGLSQAGLHVSVPVIIAQVAGSRVGRGMSFFMVAGEMARTVGPLVAVQAVSWLTLEGLWQVAPVAGVASAILGLRLRHIGVQPRPVTAPQGRAGRPGSGLRSLSRRMGRTAAVVLGIMAARGFMTAALTHYLPTLVHRQGGSLSMASLSLFLLELGGAAGALASGTLSDWLGRRRVLFGAVVLTPPLMLLFLRSDGIWTFVALVVLGAASLATTPVLMAVMLEHAGEEGRATANGAFLTLNSLVRVVGVVAVGYAADAVGLRATYLGCAAVAAFGIPLVWALPRRPQPQGSDRAQ